MSQSFVLNFRSDAKGSLGFGIFHINLSMLKSTRKHYEPKEKIDGLPN